MTDPITSSWQKIHAHMVRGHQVASGRNGDPRFPGGTLRMQMPHFRALGLDLAPFYPGTVNVSIAPLRYRVARPRVTFRSVKWHPSEPAEDFSFFDVHLLLNDEPPVEGLIYFPHPETKPEHFQRADVLELLLPFLPFLEGLPLGSELRLEVPPQQMLFEETQSNGG